MTTFNMATIVGHTMRKQDGSWRYVTRADPYQKILLWEGVSYIYNGVGDKHADPCGGMMSWDEAKRDYDVDIIPTPQEAEMIERGRLCHQVADRAKALAESIDAWLQNEKRR